MTLLKRTDEELGISPPSSFTHDGKDGENEDGISPSRGALYALLEGVAATVEKKSTRYCKPRLDWKPKKRKPAGALANIDDNASSKKARKSISMLKDATKKFLAPSKGYESFTQNAAANLHVIILRNQDTSPTEAEAKNRCWQVRCTYNANGIDNVRIILLAGATPKYGLTKIVAEKYHWRPSGTRYETAMTKGAIPSGSCWTVETGEKSDTNAAAGIIGTHTVVYKVAGRGAPFFDMKKLKVFHVMRERGDRLIYRVTITAGLIWSFKASKVRLMEIAHPGLSMRYHHLCNFHALGTF